jgi:hypothetical protein
METHYSQPKGFVGRNICLAVYHGNVYYGHIVFGSATRFLPGRNEALGITLAQLNNVANNIFYNVSKVDGKYPVRNFTSRVVKECYNVVPNLWRDKYGDTLVGFETLVELPRTGELYLRAGWEVVGQTVGFTCKRVAGKGSDEWSGKRVWNTDKDSLRPKVVLVRKIDFVELPKERYGQASSKQIDWRQAVADGSPHAGV